MCGTHIASGQCNENDIQTILIKEEKRMYLDDVYEPDDILRDVDAENPFEPDDELYELSFETGREAAEGLSMLLEEVDTSELLFAQTR